MATSSESLYDEYTSSPSQARQSQAVVKRLCPQSYAFNDAAGRVQHVPRMGYVAGTLEDAYFKQIMVFLANAEPY